jgi:hypothetical protein
MGDLHKQFMDELNRYCAGVYETIAEMVADLEKAEGGQEEESARQRIEEDALSVEVRGDWRTPGSDDNAPTHYRILLTTGGPACQITGKLNRYREPETAAIQYQDWFQPWTDWRGDHEKETLLTYARQFWFGDGG